LAAVALGIGAGAFSLRKRPAPISLSRPAAAAVVNSNEVTLQGKIRAQHVVGVAASASGNVESLLVEPGQEVFQGQVLARIGAQGLESAREVAAAALERAQEQVSKAEAVVASARLEVSRAEADVERSQMAVERAEKIYLRQRTLLAAGATPRLTFEKAEHEYESAQQEFTVVDAAARSGREHVQAALSQVAAAKRIVGDKAGLLEEAQVDLQAAEVHSPVDGFVISRHGEVGKSAEEFGEEFFQIATDLYALEVTVEPTPDALKRIHPGQQALVLLLDLQSSGMEGSVKQIRDTQVIVEFNSANPAIKPGMLADVRLKLD
jgi:HlyD family secretion protein